MALMLIAFLLCERALANADAQDAPEGAGAAKQRFAAFLDAAAASDAERAALQSAFDEHLGAVAKINAAFESHEQHSREHAAVMKAWAQQRLALHAERERFSSISADLLGQTRSGAWRAFERQERRHRVIPDISDLVPGRPAFLDIRAVVDECSLTAGQRTAVEPMLAAYEIEIDAPLRRFEEEFPALMLARLEQPDAKLLAEIDASLASLVGECLAPPLASVQSIADALEGETRECVLNQSFCRIHPAVCGRSPVEEAMRLLRLCDALAPVHHEAAEAIYADFLPRFAALRRRFIEAQVRWDEPRPRTRAPSAGRS